MRIARRVQLKDGVNYVSWRVEWREEGEPRSTSRSKKEEVHALADEIANGWPAPDRFNQVTGIAKDLKLNWPHDIL